MFDRTNYPRKKYVFKKLDNLTNADWKWGESESKDSHGQFLKIQSLPDHLEGHIGAGQ